MSEISQNHFYDMCSHYMLGLTVDSLDNKVEVDQF